jgi:sulfite exporter TauE/SafE
MTPMAPFFIGLAGSIHCMGMCGPLSSLAANTGRNTILKRIFYNGGRIVTYGLLGAIISFVGSIASLYGVQAWISLAVGVALIAFGFTGMSIVAPRFVSKPLAVLAGFLKARFAILMSMKNNYGIVVMGMINGLLPCGMTWLALGYCVTLQWPLDGFVSMILFGLGTFPAMIGFATIINKVTARLHISFRSVQTALLIISGCLLILRAVGSPNEAQSDGIVICGIHSTIQK